MNVEKDWAALLTVEIRDDLSLELGFKGFEVFGTEGDPGCPSGGIFQDDLSSGQRTDFGRIFSDKS